MRGARTICWVDYSLLSSLSASSYLTGRLSHKRNLSVSVRKGKAGNATAAAAAPRRRTKRRKRRRKRVRKKGRRARDGLTSRRRVQS